MARATPYVSEDMLTYHTGTEDRSIAIGSQAWWRWLNAEHTNAFRFENARGSFSARREQKNGSWYWYAYRKKNGKLRKVYLGKSEELTLELMDSAVALLTAFLNLIMDLGLSAKQIATLDSQTEGWIAGLQLAALSMLGREDKQRAARLVEQNGEAMVKSGEMMTLLQWLSALPEVVIRSSPQLSILYAGCLASLGQLDAADVRVQDAESALQQALSLHADLTGEQGSALRTTMGELAAIQTFIVSARGDILGTIEYAQQAMFPLKRALALAAPEGYMRTFVDLGRPMLELLHLALARGIATDYVHKLLATCEGGGEAERAKLPQRSLLLSEREMDVLRCIAAGKSNQEIAREFVVAISTIKTHVNNIFVKLGVHSRTQAVARAKELGFSL